MCTCVQTRCLCVCACVCACVFACISAFFVCACVCVCVKPDMCPPQTCVCVCVCGSHTWSTSSVRCCRSDGSASRSCEWPLSERASVCTSSCTHIHTHTHTHAYTTQQRSGARAMQVKHDGMQTNRAQPKLVNSTDVCVCVWAPSKAIQVKQTACRQAVFEQSR